MWWSYFIYFCCSFFTSEGKTEGQKLSIKKEKWVYLSGHYIIMLILDVCVCFVQYVIRSAKLSSWRLEIFIYGYGGFRAKKESWSWIAMSSPTVICFWNFNHVFKKDLFGTSNLNYRLSTWSQFIAPFGNKFSVWSWVFEIPF